MPCLRNIRSGCSHGKGGAGDPASRPVSAEADEISREGRARDQVVIATKFSFNAQPGNPNAGGNGRKNVLRALDGSLRRLKTDYVDLYILHAWGSRSAGQEVMSTLNDLVRAGKINHIGFSNRPARRRPRYRSPG